MSTGLTFVITTGKSLSVTNFPEFRRLVGSGRQKFERLRRVSTPVGRRRQVEVVTTVQGVEDEDPREM